MSELDKLIYGYAPPPVPAGLAERAASEAVKHSQQAGNAVPRRRDRRGDWKRPLWIGAASFGLAFTSAVAATVASGGRIEIPVVQQVVEAVPILEEATKARRQPEEPSAEAIPVRKRPPAVEVPRKTAAAPPQPGEPGYRKARVMQTLSKAKQKAEERRAAGLPTPRADRIERRAKSIVERREAAGLPTPSIEEVEAGLALRELRRMWLMRRAGRLDPSLLTDAQVARIADRLPSPKRERFLALPPAVQRQLVVRTIDRIRSRRVTRLGVTNPAPQDSSEGFPEPPR